MSSAKTSGPKAKAQHIDQEALAGKLKKTKNEILKNIGNLIIEGKSLTPKELVDAILAPPLRSQLRQLENNARFHDFFVKIIAIVNLEIQTIPQLPQMLLKMESEAHKKGVGQEFIKIVALPSVEALMNDLDKTMPGAVELIIKT